MSFNHYARKVRNPTLSIWKRLAALRSCIARMSWLTGERYTSMLARLDTKYRFEITRGTDDKAPDESQLLSALTEIEVERNQVLKSLRTFGQKRIRAKIWGNRQLSKVDLQHLTAIQRGWINQESLDRKMPGNRQYR